MKNQFLLLILITFITFQNTSASQADLDKEINYYADIFSDDDYKKHKTEYQKLLFSGISSPIVFDQVAEKLKININADTKTLVDNVSWYAKILSLSGNEKYKNLMIEVSENAKSKKLRRYARQSVKQLERYVIWNPLISKGLVDVPDGELNNSRLINIMSIYDKNFYRVVVNSVKQIYQEKSFKPEVIKALSERAHVEVQQQKEDPQQWEAVSWIVKTIGESGDVSYKPFLKDLFKSSKNGKIRKYTRRAIKQLKV